MSQAQEDMELEHLSGTLAGFHVDAESSGVQHPLLELDVSCISPDPNQPRKTISPESVEKMAASIRESGVIQPIIVHETGDGLYTLISGERRWLGARECGLDKIPAVIRNDLDERQIRVTQLIENVAREDMDTLEESESIASLLSEGIRQIELAKHLGKSDTWVSLRAICGQNAQWLREHGICEKTTSPEVMAGLIALKVSNPKLLKRLLGKDKITRNMLREATQHKEPKKKPPKPDMGRFKPGIEVLAKKCGASVSVKPAARGGTIVIRAKSLSELESIIEKLGGK